MNPQGVGMMIIVNPVAVMKAIKRINNNEKNNRCSADWKSDDSQRTHRTLRPEGLPSFGGRIYPPLSHLDVAKLLLDCGAKVNSSSTILQNSPLHIAIQSEELATLLLNKGALVNAKGEDDKTPLHEAAATGNHIIVKLLVNHGAEIDAVTLMEGLTPLHVALLHKSVFVAELLLEKGANVDYHNKNGATALSLAVDSKIYRLVNSVLMYKPDVDVRSNKSCIKTAVFGFKSDYSRILNLLYHYGITFNPADAADLKFLRVAVRKGYWLVVAELLTLLGNCAETNSIALLYNANKSDWVEVAELLKVPDIDVNERSENKSALFYAIDAGNIEVVTNLISRGATVKDPKLLHSAIKKGSIEIATMLLKNGADLNGCDKAGRTPLHFAVQAKSDYKSAKLAKMLLEHGAYVNAQTKRGETGVHLAAKHGFFKVVKILLEFNANVNCGDKDGERPLHVAIENKHNKIAYLLLANNADIHAVNKYGRNAFHVVCEHGDVDLMQDLLARGADVRWKDKVGSTSLMFAAIGGHLDIVTILLERGVQLDDKQERNHMSAFHFAVINGHSDVAEVLLRAGADLESRDEEGNTPLIDAVHNGQSEMVHFLLDNGADVNLMNCHSLGLGSAFAGMKTSYLYRENWGADYFSLNNNLCEEATKVLMCHITWMIDRNMFVCDENLDWYNRGRSIREVRLKCEQELTKLKEEKLHSSLSYYDVMTAGVTSLAKRLRNEDVLKVFQAGGYKRKFPLYGRFLERSLNKGLQRKQLEDGVCHVWTHVFPALPVNCVDAICGYLDKQDMVTLLELLMKP